MANCYGFSELEYKIILSQIERRAKLRKEFFKLKSDPCKHSMEAGYVFDPALQRFLSMKVTQLDHFHANIKTIRAGVFMIVLPMLTYGYVIWTQRQKREKDIRCGLIKYKDRIFKFQ